MSHMCPNLMTIEAQRTSPFKVVKSQPLAEGKQGEEGKKESVCAHRFGTERERESE